MLPWSSRSIAISGAPEDGDCAFAEAGLNLDREELGVLVVLEHRYDWDASGRFAAIRTYTE